jgi:hypothetical protein
MFETLEPAEQPLARRWPLFMYGIYCFAGLAFVVLSVRRHGLSQPMRLTLSGAMFCLSLMWLVDTVRSGTALTNRDARYRGIILIALLLALNLLSQLR